MAPIPQIQMSWLSVTLSSVYPVSTHLRLVCHLFLRITMKEIR
ncbi:hypothetical protein [Xenorhabdus doucetiae]|nr:hypothetical protein [Xenorhabdus sp. 3]